MANPQRDWFWRPQELADEWRRGERPCPPPTRQLRRHSD